MEIVNYCPILFGCESPSILLKRRFQTFIAALFFCFFFVFVVCLVLFSLVAAAFLANKDVYCNIATYRCCAVYKQETHQWMR